MNINSDIAKISDSLSGTSVDEKDLSVLGSLFSIVEPIENNLVNEDDNSKEFIISIEENKIIDYISNIIPDFNNKKIDISDFKNVEHAVKKDTSLNPIESDLILAFAKKGLNIGKNKTLTLSINTNFNLSKKLKINPIQVLSNKTENVINSNKTENITNNNKTENVINNNKIEIGIKNNVKDSNLVERVNQGDYSDKKLISKDIKSNSEFVKKVKKNNHPNKIYNLNTSNKNNLNNINKEIFKIDASNLNQGLTQTIPNVINKIMDNKNINNTNSNANININPYQISALHGNNNQYSQNNNSDLSSSGYNSVLENLLDHLDLTEQGWTSKLATRIEKAFINGGEEIEFNLKPKNLGVLKISLTLKQGLGTVKIQAENSFVTNALQQNEVFLQKLFNDQGMSLDFMAHNGNENFGSTHNFNQNEQNSKENNKDKNQLIDEEKENKNPLDENYSSRHIVNVIA